MTPENLLSEWARLFLVSLADAGLEEIVVSPGSRSTPWVAAALSSKRFRMTSVVDERSAAFFALGSAKVTGKAAAVICTSGSAAANYFPAIVEAATARVPLLVITADRPFELQDCGAPQTFDQTRLYGNHVRRFVDLGMPDGDLAALVALRRRAAQCLAETLAPEPGPVHVNARARKPLEPVAGWSDAALELTRRVDGVLSAPKTHAGRGSRRPPAEIIGEIADALRTAKRGLIVCGPAEIDDSSLGPLLSEVARASGCPVYAEATSQLRFTGVTALPSGLLLDGLDVLLRVPAFRSSFEPDVVLQVGEAPISSAWERLVAERPSMVRYVLARTGWPDPQSRARGVVVADLDASLSELRGALGPLTAKATGWTERLARANEAAWRSVGSVLGEDAALSEGGALRTIVNALPRGAILGLGNSLPVRHVDAFCRASPDAGVSVWSQRGVSGIDGVVSGAAGAAAASRRPTVLVVGDVALLHDVGGFAVAKEARTPFVVVVLDNGGGRIFEQLPLAEAGLDEAASRFWTTPHALRFEALGTLFGVAHVRVSDETSLRDALGEALTKSVCTLIEATVPPHGAREQYARLAASTEAALALTGAPR